MSVITNKTILFSNALDEYERRKAELAEYKEKISRYEEKLPEMWIVDFFGHYDLPKGLMFVGSFQECVDWANSQEEMYHEVRDTGYNVVMHEKTRYFGSFAGRIIRITREKHGKTWFKAIEWLKANDNIGE